MNVVANILNKHLGAVHNSSPLSFVQRKAINILLKNADKEIHADIEHKISMRELMLGIGWNTASKTPENLKECLNELVSIKIQWNIFEADKKSKWVTSTLLASAAIKDGYVYYSYSLPLRALLSRPNVYAKLDLGIQKLFRVKYSMLIWEYISGELSSKKKDMIITQWLTYEQILKLTYLENTAYEKRYSLFLERVLEKSLKEINDKSDVEVTYKTKNEKGRITHICFHANKKGTQNLQIDFINEATTLVDNSSSQLKQIGIPNQMISEIKEKHTEEQIQNAIDFFCAEYDPSKINNPIAYFNKALKEGWVLPQIMKKRLGKLEGELNKTEGSDVEGKIYQLDESESMKLIRIELLKTLGKTVYQAWIHPLKFVYEERVISIFSPSDFHRDWVESKYRQEIRLTAEKFIENTDSIIEFKLISMMEKAIA